MCLCAGRCGANLRNVDPCEDARVFAQIRARIYCGRMRFNITYTCKCVYTFVEIVRRDAYTFDEMTHMGLVLTHPP